MKVQKYVLVNDNRQVFCGNHGRVFWLPLDMAFDSDIRHFTHRAPAEYWARKHGCRVATLEMTLTVEDV